MTYTMDVVSSTTGSDGEGALGFSEILVLELIVELGATIELESTVGTGVCAVDWIRVEFPVGNTLELPLPAVGFRGAEPGWLNPGKPPELGFKVPLVGFAVGEAGSVELSSSGEYVNCGICRLVSLAVVFSTAATELLRTAEKPLLEAINVLLSAGFASGLEVGVGEGIALELCCGAGVGVGVMNRVDRMVWGSSVAISSPAVF